MKNIILHPNGAPVYGFLSLINARLDEGETLAGRKILDCGAGGAHPPLALFRQQGMECWGIDKSRKQLEKAEEFSQKFNLDLHLREGDMRQIPFDDSSFDYIYEHYSICHLSKEDTALAMSETYRILKPGGLCFLGLISTDTWPKSLFGEEDQPGEYWGEEGGADRVLHSLFTDTEADNLVSAWEILGRQKQEIYLRKTAEEASREDWMELYPEADGEYTREDWEQRFNNRSNLFQYVHLYFYLRKSD